MRAVARRYRVAVIGRTGRGNYGHLLDVAARTYPGFEIVAVADDNPEGLKRAAERLRTPNAYTDYRRMLVEQRPDIVVIGPRWADCHLEMVLAAAQAGASILMDKPMGRSPAECDQMIEACDRAGVKLVVAHNMRVCPILDVVEEKIREGIIGELLELRGRGKEDQRAGGEDLMVLGTHVFDLMRRFAGDPLWAFGWVTAEGKDIGRSDAHPGGEGLGLVAGDSIAGMFAFPGGLVGYFGSRRSSVTSGERWGIDLYGSKGVIAIRASHTPTVWYSPSPSWAGGSWQPFPIPPGTLPRTPLEAVHLLIRDLVEAIEQDREPVSSGRNARWTVEMAMALYWSHLQKAPVAFPLRERGHPLLT